MLDQTNYQIYPYYINKITNYENANYSPPPSLILKNPNKIEDNHSSLLSSLSKLPNIALRSDIFIVVCKIQINV